MISSKTKGRHTISIFALSVFILCFASTALPIQTLAGTQESTTKNVEDKEEKVLHYQISRQKRLSRRQVSKLEVALLLFQREGEEVKILDTSHLEPLRSWYDHPSPPREPPVFC